MIRNSVISLSSYALGLLALSMMENVASGSPQAFPAPAPQTRNAAAPLDLDPIKTLIAAGKLREAKQALENLNSNDAQALYLSATVSYELHEYEDAAKNAQFAVRSQKKGSVAWLEAVVLAGRSYYLASRPEKAIACLEEAREAGDRHVDSLYMLGNAYLEIRDFENARTRFAMLFGSEPNSASAHLMTAHMMMARNMGPDAQREAVRALELDPSVAGAHFLLGEIAIGTGNIPGAMEELRKELASNPTFPMAYYGLGQAYAKQGDWWMAVRVLEQAILLDPNFSDPYELLGKSYLKLGDLSNAEGVLRRAIAMNASNASAHYLLGQVLLKEGRLAEGKKLLDQFHAMNK
jgi:tetratricopeptide (TPR) repeat protein